MNHEELKAEAHNLSAWQRHKFLVLVVGSIIIAFFLVFIALKLYASSGAAQLDLSRPGYKSVRDKVIKSEDVRAFSSTGEIDKQTLQEFRTIYNDQTKKVTAINGFESNVLSDEALSLD